MPSNEVHIFGYGRSKMADDDLRDRIRWYGFCIFLSKVPCEIKYVKHFKISRNVFLVCLIRSSKQKAVHNLTLDLTIICLFYATFPCFLSKLTYLFLFRSYLPQGKEGTDVISSFLQLVSSCWLLILSYV